MSRRDGRRPAHRVVPGWSTATVGLVAVAGAVAAIAFMATPVTAKHAGKQAGAYTGRYGRPNGAPPGLREGGVLPRAGGILLRTGGIAAVESGLFPWALRAPISREVLLSEGPSGSLLIAGGIGADGSSVASAFRARPQHRSVVPRRQPFGRDP